MAQGRRLRIRRRLGYTSAGAASVTAAAVAVLVLAQPPADPPTQPATNGSATASASPRPGELQTRPPLGALIRTGLRDNTSERVYFFTTIDLPGQPGVKIGLNAGWLSDTGTLTTDSLVNDVKGSDRSPGFHQIGYDQSGRPPDASAIPTFGYFVGPAHRIEGVIGDRVVAANVASWSENTNVKVFWFQPAQLPPGQQLDGIRAYDRAGKKL